MSEIDQLMTELNGLDDQVNECIKRFEDALRGKVSIRVDVPWEDGTLSWAAQNKEWRVLFTRDDNETQLRSTSRERRLNSLTTGLPLLLEHVSTALQENIIKRRLALQAFIAFEKKIEETLR